MKPDPAAPRVEDQLERCPSCKGAFRTHMPYTNTCKDSWHKPLALDPLEDGRPDFEKWAEHNLAEKNHAYGNLASLTQDMIQAIAKKAYEAAWTARDARERELHSEVKALREYKKRVDIAWTAGMLGLSGEVGFKIQMHEFFTSLKVAFRQAEDEYMKTFGAEAALSETQPARDV